MPLPPECMQKGHPDYGGGRPRTTIPEKDELIKLGEELVKWATEETDELRCRYSEWYCIKKGFTSKQWDSMLMKPEFVAYYEQARVALGRRYIDGSVNPSIAQRFLRHYIPEVKKEENELLVFEASLKQPEQNSTAASPEQIANAAKSLS